MSALSSPLTRAPRGLGGGDGWHSTQSSLACWPADSLSHGNCSLANNPAEDSGFETDFQQQENSDQTFASNSNPVFLDQK